MKESEVVSLFLKLEELKKYVTILDVGTTKEGERTVLKVSNSIGIVNIYADDIPKILEGIKFVASATVNKILQDYSAF